MMKFGQLYYDFNELPFLLLTLQMIARTINRMATEPEAAAMAGMTKEFLFLLGLHEFSKQRLGLFTTLQHRKGMSTVDFPLP